MNIIHWTDNVLSLDLVVSTFWGDLFITYNISPEMNYLFDAELLALERKEYSLMLVSV